MKHERRRTRIISTVWLGQIPICAAIYLLRLDHAWLAVIPALIIAVFLWAHLDRRLDAKRVRRNTIRTLQDLGLIARSVTGPSSLLHW